MACGCTSYTGSCGCSSCSQYNCSSVCGALYVSTSFNIPACDATATITVPKLKNLQLNSYLWHPTYGYYKVDSFNALTGQVVISNPCFDGNSVAGTIVPACTNFIVTDPPLSANLVFTTDEAWIVPACGANVTVTSPELADIIVGSQIWSPLYGYYEVVSYNTTTFELVLKNNCVAGNTTVGGTVLAGAQFIIAANPVADADTTWTPVVTGSGAMTIAALVINQATYWEVGNLIFFILSLDYTLGGVTSSQVNITLPTEAVGFSSSSVNTICAASENGAVVANGGLWRVTTASPGSIIVTKPAAANWTLGAAASVDIQGFYQRV